MSIENRKIYSISNREKINRIEILNNFLYKMKVKPENMNKYGPPMPTNSTIPRP